jgi:uncharacterized protein YwqG
VPWPSHQDEPFAFLAQLDLAELRLALASPWLPETGRLWFFLPGSTVSSQGGGDLPLVLYSEAPPVATVPPATLHAKLRFKPCAVTLERYDDLADLPDALFQQLSEEESDRYFGLLDFLASGGGTTSHKVLGHPNAIQGPVADECEQLAPDASGSPWRLLLQLSSDDQAGMMWGDAGTLYVCLRENDLAARRFERAVVVLQCH